jgi:hypothetical protein
MLDKTWRLVVRVLARTWAIPSGYSKLLRGLNRWAFDTEGDGSNPFGPTIILNHLASSAKFRRCFLPLISYP